MERKSNKNRKSNGKSKKDVEEIPQSKDPKEDGESIQPNPENWINREATFVVDKKEESPANKNDEEKPRRKSVSFDLQNEEENEKEIKDEQPNDSSNNGSDKDNNQHQRRARFIAQSQTSINSDSKDENSEPDNVNESDNVRQEDSNDEKQESTLKRSSSFSIVESSSEEESNSETDNEKPSEEKSNLSEDNNNDQEDQQMQESEPPSFTVISEGNNDKILDRDDSEEMEVTESQNNNTSSGGTSETNGDQQPKDKKANKSALSLLQAYDSSDSESYDSQSDSEEEDNDVDEISDNSDMDIRRQISQFIKPRKENVAVPVNDGYRDVKPFRMIRGDDSDSESSDSNSDTNNDVIHVPASAVKEPESVVVMESNSEEEDNAETPGTVKKKRDPLRVKGELMIEDLPPIEDLKISVPEDECIIVGFVSSIVDRLVLVQALPDNPPLDLDSVLFLESGKKPLGRVFDVLGQVNQPIYCVRFNSHEEIHAKNIEPQQKVYCAPKSEYSSFVILNNIMNKGSDASWKNDIEPPSSQLDYSDDEQERTIKKGKKMNRNRNRVGNENPHHLVNPAHLAMQQQQQHRGNMNHNQNQQFQNQLYNNNWNMDVQRFQNNYSWHNNIPQSPHYNPNFQYFPGNLPSNFNNYTPPVPFHNFSTPPPPINRPPVPFPVQQQQQQPQFNNPRFSSAGPSHQFNNNNTNNRKF